MPPTKKAPKSSEEKQEKQGAKLHRDDRGVKVAHKAEKDVKRPKTSGNHQDLKCSARECSPRKEKGKSFRSSLSSIQHECHAMKKEYSSPNNMAMLSVWPVMTVTLVTQATKMNTMSRSLY